MPQHYRETGSGEPDLDLSSPIILSHGAHKGYFTALTSHSIAFATSGPNIEFGVNS